MRNCAHARGLGGRARWRWADTATVELKLSKFSTLIPTPNHGVTTPETTQIVYLVLGDLYCRLRDFRIGCMIFAVGLVMRAEGSGKGSKGETNAVVSS